MPLSPTGEPAAPEHVGLAIRSLLAGVSAGLAAVSAVLWVARTLQSTGLAPLASKPSDLIANLVLIGWLGGAMLGAALAWGLMSPIASAYRRGAFAMVAGFGSLLAALVTAPVDHFFGTTGLLALAGLATLSFVLLLRRVAR
jgi:hypothetical protein